MVFFFFCEHIEGQNISLMGSEIMEYVVKVRGGSMNSLQSLCPSHLIEFPNPRLNEGKEED